MTTVHIRSGDSAAQASPALIPMLLICASGGVVGNTYTFNPGDDVSASIGGGIGADETYATLRECEGTVCATLCTPTWTPAPSIVHVGSGPAVTCALTQGASGCYDDHTIRMTVSTAGNGGAGAAVDVAYDGSTVVETLQIPAETPGVVRGNVDITAGADLEGLHLDYTAPSSTTLTFPAGSLASSTAGLKAATATSASPVTLTPSDLLAGGIAAILANPRRLKFTTAGSTASDAPANVVITGTDLNGASQNETLNLAQTAASVTSVKAYKTIVSLAYAAGDGTGATIAIGYSSSYANAAEIVTEFNTLAVAAPVALLSRAAQVSSGQTYLEVYTTAVGGAATVTLDAAASTADTPLGFSSGASNLTATGAAATLTLPWTGLTFTFPASSAYVKNDTYTATCTGPRASLGALNTGAIAAYNNYRTRPFGFLVVGQPAPDAPTCAATAVALSGLTATWSADPNNPIQVAVVVGAPFHVASSTLATNDTNIATADAALLLAMNATAANFGNVAVEDVYLPGSASLRSGSFRRTAAISWAAKHAAAAKIAADVGDGLVPEATLLGPDLLTRARDDSRATTKLGGGGGPGFSALESTPNGFSFVEFRPGATRAGNTSRLRYIGPLTVALEIARLVFPVARGWQGQTVPVDPVTNQMLDAEKKKREAQVRTLLNPTLLPVGGDPNVSPPFGVIVGDPTSGTFLDNGGVLLQISFKPLGEVEDVQIYITATGAVIAA